MKVSEFHYDLPPELIAQAPLADRSASRMLVVDRQAGTLEDRRFQDFPSYISPGDCIVINDSKVIPSRLYGHRPTGGKVEVFLLKRLADPGVWTALVKPGRSLQPGATILFDDGLSAEVIGRGELGERTLRFSEPIDERLDRIGHIPLPPYIKRGDEAADRDRYQTVYAAHRGSVAAPTAGLHFTPELLGLCREAGAVIAPVTLHVGLGTFQPLTTDDVSKVTLHAEEYEISESAAASMRDAGRILAVGTTSLRTIESAGLKAGRGETSLFISPGYNFQHVGALLTNFHLPSTSLLLLVAAFAGADLTRRAYLHAVEERYRFYSYGDCMLVL
ncbi:MAG TPA: tRNA preQ1(34) S-adenosylmethionine ribosyltransferase-isomerase QueA [Bryobacteraceae bacterium]|jgi:S-adenosylmethionine:tRNA ribosyltransferase-isomerase